MKPCSLGRAPLNCCRLTTEAKPSSALSKVDNAGLMVELGASGVICALFIMNLWESQAQFVDSEVLVGKPIVQWNPMVSRERTHLEELCMP